MSAHCTFTCRCSRVCDGARGGEKPKRRRMERARAEGGGRGNSPALPSDCVRCCKGVQPSPVGVYAHSKGPGEGNHPASVTLTPTSITPPPPSDGVSIPQAQSQIATGVHTPHHRLTPTSSNPCCPFTSSMTDSSSCCTLALLFIFST